MSTPSFASFIGSTVWRVPAVIGNVLSTSLSENRPKKPAIQFSVGTTSGVLAANSVKIDLVRVVRLTTLILAFLLGLHHDIALALA
jgi:hypothetical protein